jgi:hypothetical protein
MEPILDSPMQPGSRERILCAQVSAADVEPTFDGGLTADGILALADHGDQGPDRGEAGGGGHPIRKNVAYDGFPHFDATVAGIGFLVAFDRGRLCTVNRSFPSVARVVEKRCGFILKCRLISLQTEKVIASFIENGLCDLRLTAHCINRNQSPLEVEQLQQFWERGDFIRFHIRFLLPEHKAGFARQ